MTKLETGNYVFFKEGDELFVKFSDGATISFKDVRVELIGLRKEHAETWSVAILTDIAVKKIRHKISEELELITFDFDTLQEAMAAQTFLSVHFYL